MRVDRLPPLAVLAAASCGIVLVRTALFAAVLGTHPAARLCRWDCRWYTAIATLGYRAPSLPGPHGHTQFAWPFLPLTAVLIALLHALTALPPPGAAAVMAALCTAALGVVGVRYRAATRPGARALTWLLLCGAMPFGLYFATGYAEGPYAVLALATLLGLARGRPWQASLPCALLLVARPTGILFGLPLAAACLARAARARGAARAAALLPGLAALVPFAAWLAYGYGATGDALVSVHDQSGWARHAAEPLGVLAADIARALAPGGPHGLLYFVAMAAVGLLAALGQAAAGRWAEAITLAGTVLLALSSGSTDSMPRLVGASPVFLLTMADLLDRVPGRWPRAACLALLLAIALVLVHEWARGWPGLV